MLRSVTDNFSVGSCQDARFHGGEFDIVVSLASPPETSTNQFLIDDGDHDYEKFEKAVDKILSSLEDDKTVLVHCNAGVSRSVSACIAAYVTNFGVGYMEALESCRSGYTYPDNRLLESARRYINEHTEDGVDTGVDYY